MAGLLRGNIHWADLNPVIGNDQGGLRPVLILSNNVFNERSGTVIAVAISQIRTLSTKRIGGKIAKASEEELALIIDGLNEIIDG